MFRSFIFLSVFGLFACAALVSAYSTTVYKDAACTQVDIATSYHPNNKCVPSDVGISSMGICFGSILQLNTYSDNACATTPQATNYTVGQCTAAVPGNPQSNVFTCATGPSSGAVNYGPSVITIAVIALISFIAFNKF